METKHVVPLLLVLGLWNSPVSAAPITYQLAGTVTQTDAILPDWLPGIDVGDPLTLSITWDDENPLLFFVFELFVTDFRVWGFNNRPLSLDPLSWTALSLLNIDGPVARFVQPDFLSIHDSALTFYGLDLQLCSPGSPQPCDDTPGFTGVIDTATRVSDDGSTLLLIACALTVLGVTRVHKNVHT
jgi:hypothetical protein